MKEVVQRFWLWLTSVFFDQKSETKECQNKSFYTLTSHYQTTFPWFCIDEVYVAVAYEDIKKTLESYKYHSEKRALSEILPLLLPIFEPYKTETNISLVWVPMHWSRYCIRGFDHIDFLLKKVVLNTGIPYISPLSTRFSFRQSKLSREKRLENRKNHFTIGSSVPIPETVILFDDVISSGATAHECARVLKGHWAKKVIGIFLTSNI